VRVAERFRLRVREAADNLQGNNAHAATRMALGGSNDSGLAGSAAALSPPR
jgi:hypothetical protein